MSVRAKFKVVQKDNRTTEEGVAESSRIVLTPVVSGSEENEEFYALTPGGQIVLETVNPTAADEFVVDEEVYVDFTVA